MLKYIFLSFALALPHFASATEYKIAVIDTERVVFATSDGKKTKETLDAEFKKAKTDLGKMEEEIRSKNVEYEKRYSVLNDSAKAKMQKEISGKMQKYQEAAAKSQADLQKHQSELVQPIVNKINKLVADIARDRGYSVVLEKSQVHYADTKLDLTDEVIHQYERGS